MTASTYKPAPKRTSEEYEEEIYYLNEQIRYLKNSFLMVVFFEDPTGNQTPQDMAKGALEMFPRLFGSAGVKRTPYKKSKVNQK